MLCDKRALDISTAIVTAHLKSENNLNSENRSCVLKLFCDRVQWHRSMQLWNHVVSWGDLALLLADKDGDELSTSISIAMLKSDAQIHLKKYSDALATALAAHALQTSMGTILMSFKALIYVENDNLAVLSAFRKMQQSSNISGDPYLSSHIDVMAEFLKCCHICQHAEHLDATRRSDLSCLMLRQWMTMFAENEVWVIESNSGDSSAFAATGILKGDSYMSVLCEYFSHFFAHKMKFQNSLNLQVGDLLESLPTAVPLSSPVSSQTRGEVHIIEGYPKCLSFIESCDGEFSFDCTLTALHDDLLIILEDLIKMITAMKKQKTGFRVLGNYEDWTWVVSLLRNISTVLLKEYGWTPQTLYNKNSNQVPASNLETSQMQSITARLNEIAEILISAIDSDVELKGAVEDNEQLSGEESEVVRSKILLLACACRIDAESNIRVENMSLNVNSELTTNLVQAQLDVQKTSRLLRSTTDFGDEVHKQLRNTALMLEFSVLCMAESCVKCQEFLTSRQSYFLCLSTEQLKSCAQIATSYRTADTEITRAVLNFALQCCVRDSSPNYSLMGSIYRELIDLSPSRKQALDRVEEFEQLAISMQFPEGHSSASEDTPANVFQQEDIDHIVSLAYNYGVTLVDLDQVSLAERFVAKAISLLPCASTFVKGWLSNMQVKSIES
jgi:hypothetical protein